MQNKPFRRGCFKNRSPEAKKLVVFRVLDDGENLLASLIGREALNESIITKVIEQIYHLFRC
jgi:hypothetical protein